MDTRKIRKLIELVKETGIGELEIKSGEESVRISCQKNIIAAAAAPVAAAVEVSAAQQAPAAPQASAATPGGTDGHTVLSPMVGTVYLAPSSGAMPFVQVGDNVKAG